MYRLINALPSGWIHFLAAVVLFVISAFFRFSLLTEIPRGLNWDETAYAYNAYSLLVTGKDEWGEPYPLFLKSFGEYKPALLSYLYIPFMMVAQNWDWVVRALPAFLNTLAVVGVYFLVLQLIKSGKIAYLTTFTLAITPWHIHFSRIALDPSIAFPFLIFGVLGWTSKNHFMRTLGSLFLILSMYSYNAERVFVPLLMLSFFGIFWWKNWKKELRQNIIPVGIFVLGSLAVILTTIFGPAGNRSKTASFLFSDSIQKETATRHEYARKIGLGQLNFLDQPPFQVLATITQKYSLYLRPDFLFFSRGGINASPILGFPQRGNLLEIFFPFFILGIVFAGRNFTKIHAFWFSWLLLAPFAGALTPDSPHGGRALIMLPAVNFFIAYGVIHTLHLIKVPSGKTKQLAQNLGLIFCLLLFSLMAASYWRDLLLFSPEESEFHYQGYYKEMSQWVEKHRSEYDHLIITAQHDVQVLLFYAWYNRINPELLHDKERASRSGYSLAKYDNISTLQSAQLSPLCALRTPNTLVVLHPNEVKSSNIQTQPLQTFFHYNRFSQPGVVFMVYDTKKVHQNDLQVINERCPEAPIQQL